MNKQQKTTAYILFILLIFSTINAYSQHKLTIEISGLRNNTGNVLYELFDEKHKSLEVGTVDIKDKKCVIVFENLKPAKYGFNYIHDENKNKKLDTKMLMIPTEGFGYSNNADGTFGPPAFKKWVFEVKENTRMNLKITYLTF